MAAFVDKIEANPSAGDPCATGLPTEDRIGGDGVNDTFPGVPTGTQVCFDVIPKSNTTVEPTDTAQMFRATIVVRGDDVTELDERDIFFLVPPEVPGIIVE